VAASVALREAIEREAAGADGRSTPRQPACDVASLPRPFGRGDRFWTGDRGNPAPGMIRRRTIGDPESLPRISTPFRTVLLAPFVRNQQAGTIQQREMDIGQRFRFSKTQMPATPEAEDATSRNQHRKIDVVVHAGIAHATAMEEQRLIEQPSFPARSGGPFLQVLHAEGQVKAVDLRHPRSRLRIKAMMGKRMMGIGDPGLRIGVVASRTRQLKRDDGAISAFRPAAHGRVKATMESPKRVPFLPPPPAAMTTYWRPAME